MLWVSFSALSRTLSPAALSGTVHGRFARARASARSALGNGSFEFWRQDRDRSIVSFADLVSTHAPQQTGTGRSLTWSARVVVVSRVPPICFQDVVLECSAGLFALPAVARRASSEGKLISCALLLSPSNAPRPRSRGSGVLAMASSSCSASSLNALVTVVRIIGLHPKLGEPNAACGGHVALIFHVMSSHTVHVVCVAKQAHDCHGDARVYSHGVCSHDV